MIKCIIIDDEPLAIKTLERAIEKYNSLELLGTFNNAISAWNFLKKEHVDLVFSDIIMPDIDGISFLKNLSSPPKFIYVTGNHEYAVESFELDVVDYIVKPFNDARFLKSINKVEALLKKETNLEIDYLIIKDRHKNVILRFEDIHYIEGSREYVTIVTGEKEYLIHKTMNYMGATLPSEHFIRVQKSYIINIDYAREITAPKVIMMGSIKDIPIGTRYRKGLYQRLGIV